VIVTDPVNHVLAFYERGDLVKLLPTASGGRVSPATRRASFIRRWTSRSTKRNIYVADYGNDRVQILDKEGKYKALLDPEFHFVGPHAVAMPTGDCA